MTFNIDSNIAILLITWLVVQVLKPTKINNHLLPLIAVVAGALVAVALSLYTNDTKLVQDLVRRMGWFCINRFERNSY